MRMMTIPLRIDKQSLAPLYPGGMRAAHARAGGLPGVGRVGGEDVEDAPGTPVQGVRPVGDLGAEGKRPEQVIRVNHKEMNAELVSLSRQLGAYCWINSGEITQHGTGWVDAVVIGDRGVLFVENKTAEGRRTRAQWRVALLLIARGLEYRLYRPFDYESGLVRKDLEAIA